MRIALVMASVMMAAALAGCAQKTAEAPPAVRGRIDISPNDPRWRQLHRLVCAGITCRSATSIHLKMPDGPDFDENNGYGGPYAQKGNIFIDAGESFFIETDIGPNGPVKPRFVSKIEHPERTLTFTLEQRPDLAAGFGVRLTVVNPFDKALKYDVREVRPDGSTDDAIGLCPVLPHDSGRKNWQYPVSQALIANLTFVSNELAEVCAP
jgi:hypothetical protein